MASERIDLSNRIKGIAASPGVSIGRVFLLNVEELRVKKRTLATNDEIRPEVERFKKAINDTRTELEALSEKLNDVIEGKQLIEVHIVLLNDPSLHADVIRRIEDEKVTAEYAVSQVLYDVLARFDSIEDPYLKSRSVDVRDVGRRVMANLMGTESEVLSKIEAPVVLVASDLDPSQTAGLSKQQILGIAIDKGGPTSHTAIIARSLGVPAVVALKEIAENCAPGDVLVIDGIHGEVIIDPDEDELKFYTRLKAQYEVAEADIVANAMNPTITADGVPFELSANIEFSQEADHVARFGGKGIGLFRTEFIRLISSGAETEEIHFTAYNHALEMVYPENVIIRTFDLGGDKFLDEIPVPERNPFLGWRAIRICLDRPARFIRQLRAVLRAAVRDNAWLMIPMISSVDEVLAVKVLLEKTAKQLADEGIPFKQDIPFGIMVETPAVAISIECFLPHVDFVSIGTNDLTQYTLAVDRTSPFVAELFDPFHPSVLSQIGSVTDACRKAGKWVGVCGQMASNPLAIPLLVGFGVDELSVPFSLIPDVKKMISLIDMSEAELLTHRALTMSTGSEIKEMVCEYVREKYPDIILEEIGITRESDN